MNLGNLSNEAWLIAAAVLLLTLIGTVLHIRRKRSMEIQIRKALDSISHDRMQDIHLPDGMGGHIHFDELLLTDRGLLVLDIKDVPGTLFGSGKMAEWVVMTGKRRHTFRNPLPGLHDRLAVVRALMRDVQADGYVVFTERGRFSKGKPPETLMLHELVERIGTAGSEFPQAFDAAWQQLKQLAEKAQEETRRPV